jgi:DNA-binding Lrp family transcriptional regulator
MKTVNIKSGNRMTVREAAEALGVSPDTILARIKAIEAQTDNYRFGKAMG